MKLEVTTKTEKFDVQKHIIASIRDLINLKKNMILKDLKRNKIINLMNWGLIEKKGFQI